MLWSPRPGDSGPWVCVPGVPGRRGGPAGLGRRRPTVPTGVRPESGVNFLRQLDRSRGPAQASPPPPSRGTQPGQAAARGQRSPRPQPGSRNEDRPVVSGAQDKSPAPGASRTTQSPDLLGASRAPGPKAKAASAWQGGGSKMGETEAQRPARPPPPGLRPAVSVPHALRDHLPSAGGRWVRADPPDQTPPFPRPSPAPTPPGGPATDPRSPAVRSWGRERHRIPSKPSLFRVLSAPPIGPGFTFHLREPPASEPAQSWGAREGGDPALRPQELCDLRAFCSLSEFLFSPGMKVLDWPIQFAGNALLF